MYYLSLAAYGLLFGLVIEIIALSLGADLHLLTAVAVLAPPAAAGALELNQRRSR